MKIRITGKGLSKAQMWNSQIGKPTIDQDGLVWGANPGIVTRQESEAAFNSIKDSGACGPGQVFSEIQQKCITQEEANIEKQALAGFKNYLDRKRRGLPTNPFKTTGNEGTPSNPMGATFSPAAPPAKKDKFKDAYVGFHTAFKNSPVGKIGEAVNRTLDVASPWITMFDNNRRTRAALANAREMALPENMFFDSTIDRGDWDQEGILRPNELGFDSKGEYTNTTYAPMTYAAYGGSMINPTTSQNMKIRITGGPSQSMAYGGQSNYGLDLGRRKVYTEGEDTKAESVSNTIGSVPREMANIEAEGGETVYGDLDGDGGLEHMKIVGPRHTNGGVPLNVPEGSFIFSDTKKMRIKDEEVLKYFGLSPRKGGYTPAEIAKRYDVNKFKAILEDPTKDETSKSTAQLMIKNFDKKLAFLAFVQEAMKGLPQGVPNITQSAFGIEMEEEGETDMYPEEMEYGGSAELPMFQTAGQSNIPQVGASQIMPQLSPETIELARRILKENEERRRAEASAKNYGELTMGPDGKYYFSNPAAVTTTASTSATAGQGDPNDPEFARFKEILNTYNNTAKANAKKKERNDKRDFFYINNLPDDVAEEFARLATKFGFKRPASGGYKGHVIIQGATPDYTFTGSDNKPKGFFAGLKPENYERKLVRDLVGQDALKKMTPLEIRKKFLTEIGVDVSKYSDSQLSDSKKLYTNKNFFENEFYPKYTAFFGTNTFRPEMKDDGYPGLEHLDAQSISKEQAPLDKPIVGYTCVTRPDGSVIPQESYYMDEAARAQAGASLSPQEALANCPKKEAKKGWRCLGIGKDNKPVMVFDELGTFSSREEAAKTCVGSSETFDFMFPDKLGMWAAAQGFPRKYMPVRRNVPFEPGRVVFEDWRAKAAQRFANNYAYPSEQLAAYTSPQSLAANMAFMAGQSGEGVAQDIAGVDSRNVATANQFLQNERQRKDQFNLLNAINTQDYFKDLAIVNQNYDNARRAWTNNLVRQGQNAWANRMYLGLLNAVNPIYNIMPDTGRSVFKGGWGTQQLPGMAMSAGNRAAGMSATELNRQYLSEVPDGKGMSFAQWRDMKFGNQGMGNQQGMMNPFLSAAQMAPFYMQFLRNNPVAAGMNPFLGGQGDPMMGTL